MIPAHLVAAEPATAAHEARTTRAYDVAGAAATVTAGSHVHRYLARFFREPEKPQGGPAGLALDVERRDGVTVLDCAVPDVAVPAHGGPQPVSLHDMADTVAARKFLRAWRLTQSGGPGLLHASAFSDDHRTFVILGPPTAGKTTLLLDAVLRHGCAGVANDALAVGERRIANIPSIVGVRRWTATRFAPQLRRCGRHLIPPSGPDHHYFYPRPFLGRPAGWRPVAPELIIVLARFAGAGAAPHIAPVTADDARDAVRAELNTWRLRHDVEPFARAVGGVGWSHVVRRSMAALEHLLAAGRVVEFHHHGCIGPLRPPTLRERTCR